MDKLFPGTWTIYAGIIAAVLLLGFGTGWEVNGWRLKSDLATMTAERNQLQQSIKDAKALSDQQHKNDVSAVSTSEASHAQQLSDTARAYNDYLLWLQKHPGSRATCTASVPEIPADAAGHGAKPARTVGISEEQILGLLQQGDACRDDLNSAKIWAQGRASETKSPN